ncbi:uncharacterized protein LOC120522074 [Polypterus senegalus]|uniref:uncharacterized protein LOC120522074 n=1 Tax=Polypterus senegalus TaxID=55291 RepID=UPI001963FA06|nr:uncharacterized protein LOC120522074 [Polypterus senegalus]
MISSDNGSAFIEKTIKKVLQMLGIKQRLGCVYHSQSQGMVERANRILKNKIAKVCADTGLNWVNAFPVALMMYRSQTNRVTHLTPHEMLTGRPMPTPVWREPHKGPSLEQLELEMQRYIRQLTTIHKVIYSQEKKRQPAPEEPVHPIRPGDQVYLRVYRRRWNQARREGPYEVTQATATAVQVKGSTTWYHLNQCTQVPRVPHGSQGDDDSASDGGGTRSRDTPYVISKEPSGNAQRGRPSPGNQPDNRDVSLQHAANPRCTSHNSLSNPKGDTDNNDGDERTDSEFPDPDDINSTVEDPFAADNSGPADQRPNKPRGRTI